MGNVFQIVCECHTTINLTSDMSWHLIIAMQNHSSFVRKTWFSKLVLYVCCTEKKLEKRNLINCYSNNVTFVSDFNKMSLAPVLRQQGCKKGLLSRGFPSPFCVGSRKRLAKNGDGDKNPVVNDPFYKPAQTVPIGTECSCSVPVLIVKYRRFFWNW
jgi:hypothetical protein